MRASFDRRRAWAWRGRMLPKSILISSSLRPILRCTNRSAPVAANRFSRRDPLGGARILAEHLSRNAVAATLPSTDRTLSQDETRSRWAMRSVSIIVLCEGMKTRFPNLQPIEHNTFVAFVMPRLDCGVSGAELRDRRRRVGVLRMTRGLSLWGFGLLVPPTRNFLSCGS